jgi:PAS domain S-box-containing protein
MEYNYDLRALIVEDDENDAFLLVRQLHKFGFNTHEIRVDTASDFVAALENAEWDIILSDFNIPGFSGAGALKLLKEKGLDIPFVLISGTIGEEAAVSIMKAGASDYLMKGNLSRLGEVIKRELEEAKNRKERKQFILHSQKLSRVLESSKEIILLFDSDEQIRYFNQSAADILNLRIQEDRILCMHDLLPPHDYGFFKNRILPDLLASGFHEGEMTMIREDGTLIPVLFSVTGHNIETKIEYSLVAVDITQRKEFEREIVNLNSSLEEKIIARTKELLRTNQELEEKGKEIIHSINYSLRIQKSILHKREDLHSVFEPCFLLELPKDIVSGDFYWVHKRDNLKFIAVIDCTGHGVPGALLSIIAHRLINKIVIEQEVTNPAVVLEMLDDEIQHIFQKDNPEQYQINDGMDIAFCVIDETNRTLRFSGAFRPFFHYSGGEIKEFSGSKRPIGSNITFRGEHFGLHEMSYLSGDRIYLFSDGYQSQIGGEKMKKINKKYLREVIHQTSELPMDEQLHQVEKFFLDWKNGYPQMDDVCIVGVRLD